MSKELNLGDKVWMHYGPSVLIVGHLIDYSPDYSMVGLSPLPFTVYNKMNTAEKADCPINWFELKACHYICHIPASDLKKQDEALETPHAGFQFLK